MLRNKRKLKLIMVVIAMVLCVSILAGCDSNKEEDKKSENNVADTSMEAPIENLIKGLESANSQKVLRAFPPFISDNITEIYTDEYLQETLKETEEEYGKNIKMSYEIVNKTEISQDELDREEKNVETNFGEAVEFGKGYKVEVKITTKGDNREETLNDVFDVYELDGKWYILDI